MKTGITRRIDNLGRIVLPKEIRNNLNIKNGESLEILVNDDETILLKKFSLFKKEEEFLKLYVTSLAKQLNCNIYLTDLSKIILSSNQNLENKNISDEFNKILSSEFKSNSFKTINFTLNYALNTPFNIYYICPNGDLIGSLIFEYDKNPTDEMLHIAKFSHDFIEALMEK